MYSVAVVTGTRAEYGLLRPVLRRIESSPELALSLLVTGAHLSSEYGHTIDEIAEDGLPIAARLDILSQPVAPGRAGTARRIALALELFLEWFEANRPDALLALGDRYEMLAAAQAAALLGIPVAHISGGDVTTGADDDWFRHCITKMAKLHFPSCEAYRSRLLRMGEQPEMVFNVGGLGDENIRSMELLSRDTLASQVDAHLAEPYALVTFHPETAPGSLPVAEQIQIMLKAIFQRVNLFYLFTGANADAGGQEINQAIAEFCSNNANAILVPSLGQLRYLSAMKYAGLVLGNSSSGVVETASFGTPTVDIGTRQAGRLRPENVIHCELEQAAITRAIDEAQTPAFMEKAKAATSPYNGGNTSEMIVETLNMMLKNGKLNLPKVFYDGEGKA